MAISGAAWVAAADLNGATAPEGPTAAAISIDLAPWQPTAFARVVLEDPQLAACFQLSTGWWSLAKKPTSLPDAAALGESLANTAALLGLDLPARLTVVVAVGDVTRPAAFAYGDTVLLMMPVSAAAGVDTAPSVAQALLTAAFRMAPVNLHSDEPLLALGEALALAGSFSLAGLPPALRPVHDWLERRNASATLEALVSDALDTSTSWQVRRARLVRVGQPNGASPELAQAAAYLIEAFGDAARARRDPLSLLRTWRENDEKSYPTVPGALKRALGKPLEAGLPKDPTPGDTLLLSSAPVERALANGSLPVGGGATDIPASFRLLAAALARAGGMGTTCQWITPGVPADLRTGCRADNEKAGFVYSRPTSTGGSEIVERSLAGNEGPLLRWPRWSLFPSVLPSRGELVFVDPQGIWTVALDGSSRPRLLATGGFRHLVPSRDGATLAAVHWPDGGVVLITPKGRRELKLDGRGGVAWVEDDVLLASDGSGLVMSSLEGETVPWPAEVGCTHSLAAGPDLILATVSPPCQAAVMRLSRLDGKVTRLLQLGRDAIGITLLPDGGLVFGDSEGLWRWRGGEHAERIGLGFTPGPG